MLGGRTRQVFSYGRRGHRIVADERTDGARREDASLSGVPRGKKTVQPPSDSEEESDYSPSEPSSPEPSRAPLPKRKAPGKVKEPSRADVGKVAARKPLSAVSANVPSAASHISCSPAAPRKKSRLTGKTALKTTPPRRPISLKPISPVVSVDIVTLDAKGKPIKQEKRISKPDFTAKAPAKTYGRTSSKNVSSKAMGKSPSDAIVLSDDEDIPSYQPKPRKPVAGKQYSVVDSEDGSDIEIIEPPPKAPTPVFTPSPAQPRRSPKKRVHNVVLSPPPSPPSPANPSIARRQPPPPKANKPAKPQPLTTQSTWPQASFGRTSFPSTSVAPAYQDPEEHGGPSKPRPATPIRNKFKSAFPAPPSPPSPTTPSDLDESLAFDLSELQLSPRTLRQIQAEASLSKKKQPAYLQPLLEECGQDSPHEFSAFIEMFPFDQIVQTSHGGVGVQPGSSRSGVSFQKIGEASYSEVFGIGDVVLKIVPLRNEEAKKNRFVDDEDCPAPSDAKDVLKEIIVTRAMGEICDGFVKLLRTYIVRGKYPSLLLNLWDEYDGRKGSESVRPDGFSVSQVYAIIVLPNGGPDLESYTFSSASKTGWRQACSLFWQVARTLAEAEELVGFEHRDLHWGQILIKDVPSTSSSRSSKAKVSMDDDTHGVRATIIDLGLSRMNSEDGHDHSIHWTPFEEETFEGEGDYQFDVYRMMRKHNGNSWEKYHPFTNVLWLHYLVLKLLHSKRLRAPTGRKQKSSAASSFVFSELECYQCLVQIEATLKDAIAATIKMPKRGRPKKHAPGKTEAEDGGGGIPKSAGDVLAIAYENGWVC